MAGVGDIDRIAFEDVSKSLRGDGDRTVHELRDVVALHGEAMGIGTCHGKFERTGGVTIFVDMCDERSGEGAIVATTAEDDPSTVAGPGVVALGVRRIQYEKIS